jgi:hypothetical protein
MYAERAVTARSRGENQLDCRFEDVESCRRESALDEYDGKPIPVEVMLSIGWWLECSGCGRRIEKDLIDNPEDDWDYDADVARPPLQPVGTLGECCCTPACRDEYLEVKLTRESAEQIRLSELETWARLRWHDIEVRCRHAYADRHARVVQASITFMFPGAANGGALLETRTDDSTISRDRLPVRPAGETLDPTLRVANGDLDAWRRHIGEAWAYPELPRLVRMFER